MMRSRLSISLALLCVTFCAGSAFGQELIYGMTAASSASTAAGLNLVSFNSNSPGTMLTNVPLTGVVSGQSLRSIDFRPSNRQLYAISSASTAAQLYTVNLATGVLTPVGSGLTLPSTNARVEIEFDPANDVIRYISGAANQNNNATINPNTGALISAQTTLAFVSGDPLAATSPGIVGAAYSNNNPGAAAPTLYGYDFASGALVRIGGPGGSPSPNLGQVTTINNPGLLSFNAGFGMDISGATNTLYTTHDDPATGTVMSLYTRNLTTGAESLVGAYPGLFITDLSVMFATAVPEPPMAFLFGCVLMAIAWTRRRTAN